MPNQPIPAIEKDWDTLVITTEANKEDLGFLESLRTDLTTELGGLREASIRQKTFKAQVQQATRDIEGHLSRGVDLANRLRNGLRMSYGIKGEKLTEFGMKPRRSRAKKKPQEPASSKKAPAADSETASTIRE